MGDEFAHQQTDFLFHLTIPSVFLITADPLRILLIAHGSFGVIAVMPVDLGPAFEARTRIHLLPWQEVTGNVVDPPLSHVHMALPKESFSV